MGNLLHSCVEVHEPIELSFGVLSVVSPSTGVLDGGLKWCKRKGRFHGV